MTTKHFQKDPASSKSIPPEPQNTNNNVTMLCKKEGNRKGTAKFSSPEATETSDYLD